MKPLPETTKSSRPLQAAVGGLKAVIAVILFWVGFNSFLIGWAYFHEKAYWVPLLMGTGMVFGGISLLTKGVRQMAAVLVRNAGRR